MIFNLLRAFRKSGKEPLLTYFSRHIDLSGNVFSFKMPEDFSRDMPAEDLVEELDLKNLAERDRNASVTLMRRWWDLREPGFFGKEQGTVMMSVGVHNKPENQAGILDVAEYDFCDLLQFIVALYDSLEQRCREHNKRVKANGNEDFAVYVPSLATRLGDEVSAGYDLIVKNQRHWIYTGTVEGKQINKIFALPLNASQFIEITFSLMPCDSFPPYSFIGVGMARVNPIVDTFTMRYAEGNVFDEITTAGWTNRNLLTELEANRIKLFKDHDDLPSPPPFLPPM